MLRVFIGYDSREPQAYHVCAHSVMTRASGPVAIIPLIQQQLRKAGLYTRERGATEATEFSMTRFLVPYLSGYAGISVFMDCDMLVRCDLTALANDILTAPASASAVWLCKHDYTPKSGTKMDGAVQTVYERKNWSSFIVFDNQRCWNLTPEYVNTATGLELHRFKWLGDNHIGGLPLEYNWLVDEYEHNDHAKILHYTNGGPWFNDYRKCDHAKDWEHEQWAALGTIQRPWLEDGVSMVDT